MDPVPSTYETIFLCPIRIQHYEKPNDSIHILFCTRETVEKRQAFQSRTYQIIYLKAFLRLASKARLGKNLRSFPNLTQSSPRGRPRRFEKMNTIDSQTGILQRSAMCVQRFDDSRKAIHTTYRISLRSSSLREPRDPLSKVVSNIFFI